MNSKDLEPKPLTCFFYSPGENMTYKAPKRHGYSGVEKPVTISDGLDTLCPSQTQALGLCCSICSEQMLLSLTVSFFFCLLWFQFCYFDVTGVVLIF